MIRNIVSPLSNNLAMPLVDNSYLPPLPYSNNLLAWYTGRNVNGYDLSGTQILQMQDNSPNSNDVISTNIYRPNLIDDGRFKVPKFTPSQYLFRTDSLGLTGNPAHTVIIVVKFDAIPPATIGLIQFGVISNNTPGKKIAILKSRDFGGQIVLAYRYGQAGAFTPGGFKYYNYMPTTAPFILTLSKPAGGLPDSSRLYINNSTTPLGNGATSSNWNASENLNLDNVQFGFGSQIPAGPPNFGLNGLIKEIVVYGENVSQANRISVVNELMNKWSIN